MRKASIALLSLSLMLIPVASAWGGGMSVLGVGARAKGMGGAFRAIADDWSAAYYNPAGLFYVTENQLTFNEVITLYQLKVNPNTDYYADDETSDGFREGDIYNKHHILTNPTLGGYGRLPIGGRDFTIGLSIFQPFDKNLSWQLFDLPYRSGFPLPSQQIEHNFDAVAFNLVLATELVEDRLSVGLSAGALKADLVYAGFFERPNPADPNAWYYDDIASRPNNLITEWQKSDGYGYAPNFRAGLLLKATPEFSIGLSYSHKTTVTIEGDAFFYYYMPDIPVHHGDDQVGKFPDSINYILSSGARYEGEATFETEITLPGQVGAGLAYRISERLIVAGDLEYTFWSDFKGYVFNYTFKDGSITRNDELNSFLTQNMSLPVDWRNTIRGAIGLQYDLSDLVILRGGYNADQSPFKKEANSGQHPAFFDPGLKHGFNLGLGLEFENVIIDFSTEYLHYPEATEGGNLDLDDDGIVDNLAGTYSGSAWESIVQFTVRF